MILGFATVVGVLMFGDFLHEPSADVLEDGIVGRDDKNIGDLEKDVKEIREVAQGAYFHS